MLQMTSKLSLIKSRIAASAPGALEIKIASATLLWCAILNALPPQISFAATKFNVADDANHYPYRGQTIEGVHLTVTDRTTLDSPELGIEILSALHHLYPTQFKLDKAAPLVANTETMSALARGDDPRAIAASWVPALAEFKARRAKYLLYP